MSQSSSFSRSECWTMLRLKNGCLAEQGNAGSACFSLHAAAILPAWHILHGCLLIWPFKHLYAHCPSLARFCCEYSYSIDTMATSTPAQEEPAQPPSTNSPLPEDSRNDAVAADESAPLLDSGDGATSTRNATNKLLRIFTSIALLSSALTLVFIIATNIALQVGNNYYGLPWSVSESMKIIIAPVCISSTPQLSCSMCSWLLRSYSRFSSQCTTSYNYAMALVYLLSRSTCCAISWWRSLQSLTEAVVCPALIAVLRHQRRF